MPMAFYTANLIMRLSDVSKPMAFGTSYTTPQFITK